MTYKNQLIKYIENYLFNTPILIEEVKKYFKDLIQNDVEYKKIMNSIYIYLNRLVKKGEINQFSNGVYYKGIIAKEQVIEKKYIKDKDKIFGYYVNNFIVSNICKKGTSYYNKTLGVKIKKPKIEITNENYIYLELLDKIKYENISREEIYKFMINNNMSFEELFRYGRLVRSKKEIIKLLEKVL